jgi:aryl-alcohol dehydrogenase-like predicted oxidoreductase
MQKRRLGNNKFTISEVGLGCWQFGGDFGPMEKNTALSILAEAVESGINFFDTADVYGNGRSEELIGEFLKQTTSEIFIATKFGRGSDVYPNNYTKTALKSAIQRSMKRLGVDVIDLIQLHCIPTEFLRKGQVFDWLEDMKRDGLIKHYGASVESLEEALICLKYKGLHTLQVIFNIFRQKLITKLFPLAQKHGVGIIVRLPLASGLLSGKFTKTTRFADTDHRNYNCNGQQFNVGETFAGLPFEKGVELADALKAYVPQDLSMAQMALRWILDHEAVSVIIPGASSPDQVHTNAAVSGLKELSKELHEQLGTFYEDKVHSHIRGPY